MPVPVVATWEADAPPANIDHDEGASSAQDGWRNLWQLSLTRRYLLWAVCVGCVLPGLLDKLALLILLGALGYFLCKPSAVLGLVAYVAGLVPSYMMYAASDMAEQLWATPLRATEATIEETLAQSSGNVTIVHQGYSSQDVASCSTMSFALGALLMLLRGRQ